MCTVWAVEQQVWVECSGHSSVLVPALGFDGVLLCWFSSWTVLLLLLTPPSVEIQPLTLHQSDPGRRGVEGAQLRGGWVEVTELLVCVC